MSEFLQPQGLKYTRLPCPLLSPRVYSNSCSLSHWWYLTVSSSATSFSFCLQSFWESGSFPESRLFSSGGQSIGASASVSVLPVDILVWFPLGLTSLISLQFRGLLRVFSSAIIWTTSFNSVVLSFFMVQLSYPYMITGKTIALTVWTFVGEVTVFAFWMMITNIKRMQFSWTAYLEYQFAQGSSQ